MNRRSNTILYGMVVLPLFCLVLMRKEKPEIWEVEYVLIEKDTLYLTGNCQATYTFYNHRMGGIQKSQSDKNYIHSCMRNTCNEFRNAELILFKKKYKLTTIKPCWDQIKIEGTNDGVYTKNDKGIQLISDNISLSTNKEKSILTYKNSLDDYEIVFKRQ